MQLVTIEIYPVRTKHGNALTQAIKSCLFCIANELKDYTFTVEEYKARENELALVHATQSALGNKILIIDGSLDEETFGSDDFGINYECLSPLVMNLDNVLVVSRTQIPLNFVPTRTNVKPLGKEIDIWNKDNTGKAGYKLSYTNNQIIHWLRIEILKMAETGRLARPDSLKMDTSILYDNNPSQTDFDGFMKREYEIMNENNVFLRESRKTNKVKCFISYRNRYYKNENADKDILTNEYQAKDGKYYSIIDVKNAINKRHKGNAETVFFLPGILSNELMPEVRRWLFLSYTDRTIRDCDEFWIFNTNGADGKKDGYWDSWWCLGEILTILYMRSTDKMKSDFKVMLFNPDAEGDKVSELDISKWHNLTKRELREVARYHANSDVFQSGYESVKYMREAREMTEDMRKLMFEFNQQMVSSIMNAQDVEMDNDELSYETYEESVFSHVYDISFFNDRILCVNTQKGNTIDVILDKDGHKNSFVWNFLNINGWYSKPENNVEGKEWFGIKQQSDVKIVKDEDIDQSEKNRDYFYI